MWANRISIKNGARGIVTSKNKQSLSFMMKAALVIIVILLLPVFAVAEYSSTTKKCISCHNDTGYPLDSDGDGVAAPYKRPHNNDTMCESCHGADPHTIKFIQPDGTYAGKSTAASCPNCHQTGIPQENNTNFTQAFRIPTTLRHSSNPSNGSEWGTFWTNSNPKTACMYCHNNTLHNIFPMGRILEWSPDYIINGSIGGNSSCASCHYKGNTKWNIMNSTFAAAGLETPPEITNGTNWKGIFPNYYNHTIEGYADINCKQCHGLSLPANARMSEFLHNVSAADMDNCMACHTTVTSADLGLHSTFSGTSAVENGDCKTCHYRSFPMVKGAVNNSNTYFCADCHTTDGTGPNKSTRIFTEKKHGKAACMDCHVADGTYHQGNPRGSVANLTYVNRFNTTNTVTTDCADCHRAANLDDAPFNAPGMGTHSVGACATGGCHGGGNNMVQVVHNTNPLDSLKPTITVPILNSSTVTQGTDVNVTVTVNFATNYALIDGAQYRIMSGPTEIKSWTPMSAISGDFGGSSTSAIATINTNNLSSGTYTIEVRGMAGGPSQNPAIRYYPMNGDISTTNSVTLSVNPLYGYINGTITSGGLELGGVNVSTNVSTTGSYITGSDGRFSLNVPPGFYNVTASKQPAYNDNITLNKEVTALNTSYTNMSLTLKPTGNINGVVTG